MSRRLAIVMLAGLLAGCAPAPSASGLAGTAGPGGPSGAVGTPPPAGTGAPAATSSPAGSAAGWPSSTAPVACAAIATAVPSGAAGATIPPSAFEFVYARIAQAYNDAARVAMARLADAGTSVEALRSALAWLADAERCFRGRLDALGLSGPAGAAAAELRRRGDLVLARLEELARAGSSEAVSTGLPDLTTRLRAAGEAARTLRKAMTTVYFEGWATEPPSIAVGPSIAAPGEIWARSSGWGITNDRGSFSLSVDNPWDAFALDVTVHAWFVAEGGSDYMPPVELVVGSVGPGGTSVVSGDIKGRRDVLLDELLPAVAGVGHWQAVAPEPIAGR